MTLLARLAADPERRDRRATISTRMAAVADDAGLDPAFKALALALPSEDEIIAHIAGAGATPDPLAVYRAPRAARGGGRRGRSATRLDALYADHAVPGPLQPRRRRRRPPRPARPGAGADRPPSIRRRAARRRAVRRRRQHDRAHDRAGAPGRRRARRGGAGALPRAWAGRPAGDRQVVRRPGRPGAAGDGGRDRRAPRPPPRLRLEEPQPLPRADRRLRHGQPGRLPPRPTAPATGW